MFLKPGWTDGKFFRLELFNFSVHGNGLRPAQGGGSRGGNGDGSVGLPTGFNRTRHERPLSANGLNFANSASCAIATFAKLKRSPKADIHLCNLLDFSLPSLSTQRVS